MFSNKVSVLRNGKPLTIISRDLLVGDLILFEQGDVVPCDCLIMKAMKDTDEDEDEDEDDLSSTKLACFFSKKNMNEIQVCSSYMSIYQ